MSSLDFYQRSILYYFLITLLFGLALKNFSCEPGGIPSQALQFQGAVGNTAS
jgi:hypothetical protein